MTDVIRHVEVPSQGQDPSDPARAGWRDPQLESMYTETVGALHGTELGVDHAVQKLAALHLPKGELVKRRCFTGMTFEEAASVLGFAVPTAKVAGQASRA